SGRQSPVPKARPRTVPDTTLNRIRCPAFTRVFPKNRCERAASGISPGTKNFFAKTSFTQRLPPLWDRTIFGQVFVRGGMIKFSKWKVPLPGGQARRNKLLVSWGPLVIAPPLAGSLLAPLRCAARCRAARCQSRARATWPPPRYPQQFCHCICLIFKCRRSQGFLYDCRGQTRVNAPCASPPYFNQAAYSVMRRCQVLGTKRKSCARPEHYLTRLGHLRQSLLYCTTPSYHSRDGVRGPT